MGVTQEMLEENGKNQTEKVEITETEREWMQKEYDKLYMGVMQQWATKYGQPSTHPPQIAYCMNFYEERMAQVKRCVKRVQPYVDRIILVYDDSVGKTKKWLQDRGCELYYRKWDNHFSKQRNAYLDPLKEGEWVLVSDPDELHSLSLLKDIRKICAEAEKQGVNLLGINAHDITTQLDGSVTQTISNWFKNLLFKYEEGVRYAGCVHETLLPGIHGWRPANLDKKYYYEHIKSMVEIKERGARNVFCGGGGNNVKDKNPMYTELQKWANKHDIKDWAEVRQLVRFHPPQIACMNFYEDYEERIWKELRDIIVAHRNDSGWDWENESRDFFLWCKALHSREFQSWESMPQPPSQNSPPEVMAYVEEQYLKILGRNADDLGKEEYTKAILGGHMKREDLINILMKSEEYCQKHGL